MPKKASGEPKVKRVERPQSNGDIYILNSALNYNEEGTGTFILNALKIAL